MDFIFPENFISLRHENHGLLALAQLILPSEILSNFEVVRVEEEASLIRIYLDESVKADYKENPLIESKGFCDAVTIRNFQGFREKILEKDEEKKKIGDSRIGGESPIEYCCFDDETKGYLFFDFPMASKCRRTNTLYSFLSL